MPRTLLLDMDPGVDDALALILALRSPEVEVLGVTTVAGNAPLEMTTRNALRVLQAMESPAVPVAAGSSRPLVRELQTALHVHGSDGLGESGLSEPLTLMALSQPGVEWMIETIREQGPGQVTLVATGPLTNVATAFRTAPDLPEALDRLVIMGGAFGLTPYGHGNVTPVSEFNIWADPEAADVVFRSGARITLVGLDVTTDPSAVLSGQAYHELQAGPDVAGRIAAQICALAIQRDGALQLHDPLALAVALEPTLVETETYPVEVVIAEGSVRGQTIADRRSGREVQAQAPLLSVCTGVDGPRFLELFLRRLTQE